MNNLDKDCFVKIKSEWVKAEFMGFFQYSHVLEPSMVRGGHSGGVIAYPIAVVKLDGILFETKISNINFRG